MILLQPIIKLLSYLPLRILYFLSTILYHLVYHVFTYRRVTVRKNLCMSFPDYPSAEIRKIEKAFYRHFCDVMVESIKAFSITPKMLDERVTITNLKQIRAFVDQGKSVTAILGHMGNWEWILLKTAQDARFPFYALYQPTSNHKFDAWLKGNRQRFGASLFSTRNIKPLLKSFQEGSLCLGTLGDQGPVEVDRSHWVNFLRQPTPVYTGTEKLARKYDMAVFFANIHKTGRGYYHVRLDLITDQPNLMEENQITEIHTKMLEASIIKQPEIWLWTHRRWKRSHLKPEGFK